MRGGRAALDPAHRQGGLVEVDLVPAQVDQLADPQTMTIGHQDHGGVAVTVAVVLDLVDQTLDLGLGQVLPRPQFGVRLRRAAATVRFSMAGATSLGYCFATVFCPCSRSTV